MEGRYLDPNVGNESNRALIGRATEKWRCLGRGSEYAISQKALPGVPTRELVIHSLRFAEHPLQDTAFDPWPYLNPRTFVRGVWRPDGSTIVPDPEDNRFLHQFLQERRSR